jgi:hypothetical protein
MPYENADTSQETKPAHRRAGWFPLPPASAASLSAQPWKSFLSIIVLNVSLVYFIVLLDRSYNIDYWNIVRDPNAIAGQPAYFGFYSGIGSLLWIVAGSTALFAAGCLRQARSRDRRIPLLFLGGLFCALAGLDDFFMLHEHSYLIGIPEIVVMGGYALFILAVAAAAYPVAHLTNWIFLGASLLSLGLSVVVDMADLAMPGAVLLEESLKFFGIAFLAAYLVTASVSSVSTGLQRKT